LPIADIRQFNTLLIQGWLPFVSEAPDEWKEDGFIEEHVPIGVTSRFGQNQPICLPNEELNEANIWEAERDYRKVKYVSLSLATDIW
jgi:hypothetical protein